VWVVVLGVLAAAATLTYLVLSPPDADEMASAEPGGDPGAHASRADHGSWGSSGRRHYSGARFVDGGVRLSQEAELRLRDPQLAASLRSYPETDGGVTGGFAPMMRIAHVTEVRGDSAVEVGERCEVRVLPVQTMEFNCLARVQCGDALLYPDPSQHAGYVACELSEYGFPNRATDANITGMDGDPALTFDLPQRRVVVRDGGDRGENFSAVLRIDPLPRFTQRRTTSGDGPS
jgi:hypothetical protein